jgi:hypothetical protein
MHLDHSGSLTCTHSIAETVTAVASEAKRRGADYVRVTWDDSHTYLGFHDGFHDASVEEHVTGAAPRLAMERAMREHDPFQSGQYATLPTWYVANHMAMILGAESIVLGVEIAA